MKISTEGLALTTKWEGERLHTYNDAGDKPTIGVGHLIKPGESFPNGITHEQAMELLAQDMSFAEKAVNELVKVTISQNAYDSLCDFAFNLGTGALTGSTLLKLLNEGKFQEAAAEFPKWCKVAGGTNQGLLNRRRSEQELFLRSTPETPAERLCRVISSHVGCSLKVRRDELGKLVARGVDDPEKVVTIATNCATTALGVMKEAGVVHPLLNTPYVSGMAVSWVMQVGRDKDALIKHVAGGVPNPGSLMHYNTVGKNDDHMEWLLSAVAPDGTAQHAGGGRTDNAITMGTGDIWTSWGRPLVEWLDPDKLLSSGPSETHQEVSEQEAVATIPMIIEPSGATQPQEDNAPLVPGKTWWQMVADFIGAIANSVSRAKN